MVSSKENLNNDHGFIARPYARKKVIRKPDGTTQIIYEDVRTGKQVNPQGYTVIQSDNTVDNVVAPTKGQSLGKDNNQPQDKSPAQQIIQHGGENPNNNTSSGPSDNGGYFNKPGWMGFAGLAPGPLGVIGKLGNVGINVSNTAAVNQQKAALGFASPSAFSNVNSAINDQHGYIGDLSTPKTGGTVATAPVGFEGSYDGRTSYTPNEARMREQLAGATPATAKEKETAIGTFSGQYPNENKGFFGSLAASAKGLFGNIFGGTTKTSAPTGSTASANASGGNFPNAPSAPNPTNSANNSPDDRDNHSNAPNGGYSSPGLF